MIDYLLIGVCVVAGLWLAGDTLFKSAGVQKLVQRFRNVVPDGLVSDDGFSDRIEAIEHAERLLRYQVDEGLSEASQHLRKSIAAMYLTAEEKSGE